jgi:hypothetical protein
MSLYEEYGATDFVVDNDFLELSSEEQMRKILLFPDIVQYLQNFDRRRFSLSIKSKFGTLFKEAFLDRGKVVAVSTDVHGEVRIFISQHLIKHLKSGNLSIVTRYENWISTKKDTRYIREISVPKLEEKKFEPLILYHNYMAYREFRMDFVTKKESLIIFPESYTTRVIGSVGACVPIYDFLRNRFKRGAFPFKFDFQETFCKEKDIIGVTRSSEAGMELFLSKEGYRFLKNGDYCIIRAKRAQFEKLWDSVEVVFDPMWLK